jgi:hypothetical protein
MHAEGGGMSGPGATVKTPPAALGARWTVTAGLLPGLEDPEFSRSFELTGEERRNLAAFVRRQGEALTYATELGLRCLGSQTPNWVRVDFMWL